MSEIALYDVLTKMGADPEEAKEAVSDVASSKEVASKTDIIRLESFVKETIAKQDARLTWRMVVIGLAIVGIIKYL